MCGHRVGKLMKAPRSEDLMEQTGSTGSKEQAALLGTLVSVLNPRLKGLDLIRCDRQIRNSFVHRANDVMKILSLDCSSNTVQG